MFSRCTRKLSLFPALFVVVSLNPILAQGAAVGIRTSAYAVSPIGDQLAIVDVEDRSQIELWDLVTRGRRAVVEGKNADAFTAVLFSPDGKLLAAGTQAGDVLVWQSRAGDLAARLPSEKSRGAVTQLEIAPDGATVVSEHPESRTTVIWDLKSRKVAGTIPGPVERLRSCWFTVDGGMLTAVFSNEVWQWRRGLAATKLYADGLDAQGTYVSPGGVLAAVNTAKGLELWNVPKLARAEPLEYDGLVSAKFTRDGRWLLVARGAAEDRLGKPAYALDLWDISKGLANAVFRKSLEQMASPEFALAPDHSRVAYVRYSDTAIHDGIGIYVASLTDSKDEPYFGRKYWLHTSAPTLISTLAFSPDGRYLASAWTDGTVGLWDLKSTCHKMRFPSNTKEQPTKETFCEPMLCASAQTHAAIRRLEFAAGGNTLVGHGDANTLVLWSLANELQPLRQRAFAFERSSGYTSGPKLEAIDFSPDGKLLAAVAGSTNVVLVKGATGDMTAVPASPFLVRFNKSGGKLYMISQYSTQFYDVRSRRVSRLQRRPSPTDQSYSERLTIGVSFERDTQAVVDPDTGAAVAKLKPEHVRSVGQSDLSRDGTKYALLARTLRGGGQGVEVFDVRTSQPLAYMPLDLETWCRVRFSPDPSKLLIATNESVVVVDYRRRRIAATLRPGGMPRQPESKQSPRLPGPSAVAVRTARDEIIDGRTRPVPSIRCMDVSPDGMVAVGGLQGSVALLDLNTGKHLHAIRFPATIIETLLFSDDGKQLACVAENRLFLLDLTSLPTAGGQSKAEPPTAAQRIVSHEASPDDLAEQAAARVKVAQALTPLLNDESEQVRKLAAELLRQLEAATDATDDHQRE